MADPDIDGHGRDGRGDHPPHVRVQVRKVDLVAEPAREGGDRPLGVIARAVEAPIDDRLDPPAQGLEERRDESVDAATATGVPLKNDASMVCEPRTVPRNTTARIAVTAPYETVRLMIRSMS